MTTLRWGSATDVGMVRENNQDALLVAAPLFAVADGMGGHRGGEVASATALEILASTFGSSTSRQDLVEAVRRANAKVWDKAQLDDDLRGMGTTLTALAKVHDETGNEQIVVANVGDSRTYLLREGEISQLTSDHSFVEEMIRAGEITAEEAEVHPKRNIVTRALGVEPTVDADVIDLQPVVGDRLLLCSDGLTREVTDAQIAATLRQLKNPEEAARELVNMAKSNGGHDNITVVIVDVEDGESQSRPAAVTAAKPRKEKKARATRKRTGSITKTLAFLLAFLGLIGIGIGSVIWYARSSHFVGLEGQQLVIYRGQPEKVLIFEPTVTERTNVSTSDVPADILPELEDGKKMGSLGDARDYIVDQRERKGNFDAAAGIDASQSVAVPALVGFTEQGARDRLAADQLQANTVPDATSSAPAGTVSRTEPAAGAQIARGTAVTIYIATPAPETPTTTAF